MRTASAGVLVFLLGLLLGAAPLQAQRAEDQLEALRSADVNTRQRTEEFILSQRAVLLDGLLAIIRNADTRKQDPGLFSSCVSFLGKLRAPQAVPDLIALLTFDPRQGWQGVFSGGMMVELGPARRPAAWALIQIGSPAIQPTIAKLAQTQDTSERRACWWVLESILGADLAKAAVQIALDKETDGAKKAGLEAGLDWLQHRGDDIAQPAPAKPAP